MPAYADYGSAPRAPQRPEPTQPQQPAWSPQPPAPFPSAQTPPTGRPALPPRQPAPPPHPSGLAYPSGAADVPRTEPPRRTDPSSYDLGSYGLPPQMQAGQPHIAPRDLHPPMPPQQPAPQQWHQQASQPSTAYGYPAGTQPHAPQLQPQHAPHPLQAGYPPQLGQPQGMQQPGAGTPPAQYEDDVEYDEPPRKRRRWLVLGALAGSIAVGSGMAYAYKLLTAPKSDRSQVVRAPKDSAKATPSDRGGKQFPNADSRVNNNNRLPSEGTATAAGGGDSAAGFTNSSGVRVVQTVPMGPGGSTAVPGMTIVGPGTGPGSTLPTAAMQPPPGNVLPPAIQSSPPVKTPSAPAPQPPAARPPPRPAPQAEAEPPQRVARAEPPKAATPAEQAASRPKTVSGYVAVLGFQRSQLEAMKMMADLQQKYDALRDRKLEIVQSDQSSRGLGTIYRVVVGPRTGITPVREVCNQLFQAGMPKQGCYPLAE